MKPHPMNIFEVNFDGLVGPSHNYAGLSFGNVASSAHEGRVSSPRQAALQGLEKMWAMHQLGLPQGVLPPHERPCVRTLRQLGFTGSEPELLAQAQQQAPELLAMLSAASAAWVANAATISPFPDTQDGKTHLTPANLHTMFHRAIEADTTANILKAIFRGDDYCHHPPLPQSQLFADEGAANHTRLCGNAAADTSTGDNSASRLCGDVHADANSSSAASTGDNLAPRSASAAGGYGAAGVALFVYGVSMTEPANGPRKFPARQTLQASQAIARSHGLDPNRTVFAQQNPAAIDAGVFHNDVIAVGNREVLFYHEQAFADTTAVRAELSRKFTGGELHFIEVPKQAVSLTDAVASYLFNSQLVCLPGDHRHTLIAPLECQAIAPVHNYLQQLAATHPRIAGIHYHDLRQSMQNGGGPACLRLRVVMSEAQLANLGARVILNEPLYHDLRAWIEQHYRDHLALKDLADPALLTECRTALAELGRLLGLEGVLGN